MASGTGATSQHWKTPSVAHQQKYSLVPLPDDFVTTKEEEALLNFYDTFKNYERQAKIVKDAAARAKLAAKEKEFREQNNAINTTDSSPKKKRKKKKSAATAAVAGDSDVSDGDDSIGCDESTDEEGKSSYARREEKLKALREEVEAKISAAAAKEGGEDALRQELLTAAEDDEDGPSLKRKKIEPAQKSSLIASISNQVTPPHDFSKKLELSSVHGQFHNTTTSSVFGWLPSRISHGYKCLLDLPPRVSRKKAISYIS